MEHICQLILVDIFEMAPSTLDGSSENDLHIINTGVKQCRERQRCPDHPMCLYLVRRSNLRRKGTVLHTYHGDTTIDFNSILEFRKKKFQTIIFSFSIYWADGFRSGLSTGLTLALRCSRAFGEYSVMFYGVFD